MKSLFYIISILFLAFSVNGQVLDVYKIGNTSGDTVILLDKSASSLVLSSSSIESVANVEVMIDSKFFTLGIDYDLSFVNDYWSHLHILSDSAKSISVNNISSTPLFVHVLHVEKPELNLTTTAILKEENCALPHVVSQLVWREGLAVPDYERIFTDTEHIIVHHSAGSNDDDDYTNVVRNIYVYHTQTRGWSDVGYNYLIAQDGTIYAGRDPGVYPQDKVQGAHFSGSNALTMGICVLGNYEEVIVPQVALESLIDLITWKCAQDNLYPYGTSSHPLNNDLAVIAGHKEGGATLCPGEHLYSELPYIKDEVANQLRDCGYDIPSDLPVISSQEIDLEVAYDFFTIAGDFIQTSLFSDFNRSGSFIMLHNKTRTYQIIIIP